MDTVSVCHLQDYFIIIIRYVPRFNILALVIVVQYSRHPGLLLKPRTIINFPGKWHPGLLFGPGLLLIFQKIGTLDYYLAPAYYSELKSR